MPKRTERKSLQSEQNAPEPPPKMASLFDAIQQAKQIAHKQPPTPPRKFSSFIYLLLLIWVELYLFHYPFRTSMI